MDDKVIVTSMVSGQVGIVMPEIKLYKTWPKKGSKLPIPKELLREAIYDPGVEYMFQKGILSIDDMDFKIELGLEPEGAKEPTNVLVIDDKYMDRMLRRMPVQEMKANLVKMSEPQKLEFMDYIVAQTSNVDLGRINVISEFLGKDLLRIIELKKQRED